MENEFKFCEHCGEKIGVGAQICPKCGYACSDSVYVRQSNSHVEEDVPSGGMNALSFFIPLIGIILYFTTKNETPIRAKSMLKFAIIGICVGVGFSVLIYVITLAATMSMVSPYLNY